MGYGKALPHNITRHAHPKPDQKHPTYPGPGHRGRLPRDDRQHPPPTVRRGQDDQPRRPLPATTPASEMSARAVGQREPGRRMPR
jgi:hypothetical protein